VVEDVVKIDKDQVAGGGHFVFQQDGPQTHHRNRAKDWCTENLWEKILLPSSPDCNPFDYFVWGISEPQMNKIPLNHFCLHDAQLASSRLKMPQLQLSELGQ
jgi:hypothetical protein